MVFVNETWLLTHSFTILTEGRSRVFYIFVLMKDIDRSVTAPGCCQRQQDDFP